MHGIHVVGRSVVDAFKKADKVLDGRGVRLWKTTVFLANVLTVAAPL